MTYTQYTIQKQKPLVVLYRCGHCDKLALQMVSLKVNISYNDKGTFARAGVEKRAARAEAMGQEKMDERLLALKSGRDTSVFARAKLKCACPHCGKSEPWAQMELKWMDNIASIAGFVALLCFAFMENALYGIIAAGTALGVFLLRLGYQRILRSRIDAQMKKCPPLFDNDLERLHQRALMIQGYADMDWDSLLKGSFSQLAGK